MGSHERTLWYAVVVLEEGASLFRNAVPGEHQPNGRCEHEAGSEPPEQINSETIYSPSHHVAVIRDEH